MLRTHTCGELRKDLVGQEVTICGWVDSYRAHSQQLLFIDLRDRYGKTQVVFGPEASEEVQKLAATLRNEFVIQVSGKLAARADSAINPKIPTGEIELRVEKLTLLNECPTTPFQISEFDNPNEELRLKYRYLDLRRPELQKNLFLRHRMVKMMRDYFDALNFLEIETPILGRSTPEGARDYLVPSRVHAGKFYALPQSPQLYKQILMVSGYDRYMQVARCFRDEDLRADRQPEFTQLDLEMSFVETDDILEMIEGLVKKTAKEVLDKEISIGFSQMTYDDAMDKYGHDAPDLRFDIQIVNITDIAAECEFRVFKGTADAGNFVRGMRIPGAAEKYSRKDIDELTEFVVQDFGAKGMAWFKVDAEGKLASPIAKMFDESLLARISERMEAQPGDMLVFLADTYDTTGKGLYGLRKRFGKELELYGPEDLHCSWIIEFPMFAKDEESGNWAAVHHPFTAPLDKDIALLDTDPGAMRAKAYDLIINGSEAGGGTIRIHDGEVQKKVFGLLGIDEETAQERFGFLLDALKYGAPPHGGIALGVDRWIMLFAGLESIRDVVAFPKTQRAFDMMTEAPGSVDPKQLRELYVKTVKPSLD